MLSSGKESQTRTVKRLQAFLFYVSRDANVLRVFISIRVGTKYTERSGLHKTKGSLLRFVRFFVVPIAFCLAPKRMENSDHAEES